MTAKRPLSILLSEGSSLSARQAITVLGLAGHSIEICDSDPRCVGRFSRFVRRYHACPGLGVDPEGYLAFILAQLDTGGFDVLFPSHEQAFLFAKVRERLAAKIGLALPNFDSYQRAHSKVGFSRLLTELDLPQPQTRFAATARELSQARGFPFVAKMSVATASRGVAVVRNREELERTSAEFEAAGAFDDLVLMQELAEGPLERAQAVFCDGRLVGFHAYRQILEGGGGGDAIKQSVRRPLVRAHLARIGAHLDWHGALSVDYIVRPQDSMPLYIDCNPRLVEPVNAYLSGIDLPDLLVRISLGEKPADVADGREGVFSHMAIQGLLRTALRDGSRAALLAEGWRLSTCRPPYRDSQEELTPVRLDWKSSLPLALVATRLFVSPGSSVALTRNTARSHQLNPVSIRVIRERIVA